MSVRRQTANRLTLLRYCETCGKAITTTADTPFVRQMPKGVRRQATVYFCAESCEQARYKYIFDGKAHERRLQKDRNRDKEKERERHREYYTTHAEERRQKAKLRRQETPGMAAADSAYHRRKRKLLIEEAGYESANQSVG